MPELKINGETVNALEVAYEGCHKIYLVTSAQQHDEMAGYGYEFHALCELPEIWDRSCGLRFISEASDSGQSWVAQDEDAVITYTSTT